MPRARLRSRGRQTHRLDDGALEDKGGSGDGAGHGGDVVCETSCVWVCVVWRRRRRGRPM